MPIKGEDLYEYASELYTLQKVDSEEIVLRQVSGRAYYGAFLFARDKAGLTSTSADVHKVTSNYWRIRREDVANHLDDLKKKRTEADYQINGDYDPADAGKSLKLARKIITKLSSL